MHGFRGRFVGLAFLSVVTALAPAAAQDVWVDASHTLCPGTGTQADPFCKIQDAVCNLKNGAGAGTVHVLPGSYNEAVRMFPNIDLISTDGPSVTTINPTTPVVQACYTSSCTVGTVVPCSAVYFGGGANGRIEGFRVTGGGGIHQTCAGGCDVQIGGGITVFNAAPTITRNEIVNNSFAPADPNKTISFYGGGIYVQGDDRNNVARPVITENLIEGNLADPPAGRSNSPSRAYGGGIYAGFYSAPVIRSNTVRSNTVGNVNTNYQQAGGGGIAFYSGIDVNPGLVDANRIEDNLASDFGGGLLLGEFLEGGQSIESPSLGSVQNNVIVGNDAFDGGGAQTNTTGVRFRSNTVVDNIASSGSTNGARGGGVQVFATRQAAYQLTLVNNIIAFNTAEDGTGGSPGMGGGLYVDGGADPTVRFEDLNGNLPTNVGGAKSDGDYIGSNGNISVDPMFVDRPLRDYRLLDGSPLLETADVAETPTHDFDGAPRPQDANEDGTPIVDYGAFEFPADFDRDGLGDWLDPDDDNDGTLDAADCAPRNRAVTGPPEALDHSLRIDKSGGTTLHWMRSFQGHTYNVYRGTIQSPWAFDETCADNEVPEAFFPDPQDPLPGEGFYYLVTARNTCGETTYADGGSPPSTCSAADRDTDLDLRLDPGDNCPTVANSTQGDADSDFVGDACDLCPSTFDPGQGDADGDLRGTLCDNCPAVANADQMDGDSDLIGDACDNCTSVSNPAQIDTDLDTLGDACDPDDDNDGLNDASDNCQLTPNPSQIDTDLDTLGDACDPDDDNDGLDDSSDNCQLTPNPSQIDTDLDTLGDACDPDDDNDGVEDALDCAPLDANASTPPGMVLGVRVDQAGGTSVSWTDQGAEFVYDVTGGGLLEMRGEGGIGSAACLNDDGPAPSWTDGREDPAEGDGFYYLIRSQNACGAGSYGDDSGGTPRTPAAACP